ncbi:MAG: 30S ribosomal protein S8 [bacterium]|nr:30S ribosomal protein S8 [bacterium]
MKKLTRTNYSIGDFLIRIKNAGMAGNKEVSAVSNSKIDALSQCLKKMRVLDEVEVKDGIITVKLAFRDKKPVLMDLRLVSTPGLRIYMPVAELEAKRGPSTYVISTPLGILSSKEAIKSRSGGEVIAEIW